MKSHSRFFAAAAAALLLSAPGFAQGQDQAQSQAQNQEDHAGHAGHATTEGEAKAELVTDPVCGMKIDPKTAAAKSVYKGETYYFCSKDEKAKFDKEPAKYVKKQG